MTSPVQRARVGYLGFGLVVAAVLLPPARYARSADIALSEERICSLDWVVIAKVTSEDAYINQDQRDPIGIWTNVHLMVEASAHGQPPPTIDLKIPGGTIGNERVTVSDTLSAHVGSRYLLFMKVWPKPDGISPPGLAVMEWLGVDPDVVLPSNTDLARVWAEHCTATADRAGPTQALLLSIPKFIMDRSGHDPASAPSK